MPQGSENIMEPGQDDYKGQWTGEQLGNSVFCTKQVVVLMNPQWYGCLPKRYPRPSYELTSEQGWGKGSQGPTPR